jgi:mRNA interferase MazF
LAITSQEPSAGYPLTYQLADSTLPKPSWVKISQIRTLSVERLSNRIGQILPEDLEEIIDGLNEIIAE